MSPLASVAVAPFRGSSGASRERLAGEERRRVREGAQLGTPLHLRTTWTTDGRRRRA